MKKLCLIEFKKKKKKKEYNLYFLDSLYRYSKKLPLFFRFKSHIDELVKAFHSTESKENKLKILTLSPFTIERTMEIFGTTNYLVKKSKKLKN